MSIETLSLALPRNAFTPRDTARAGDIWRLLQDAAVQGSTRRGWPPERYQEARCAFIVRSMTVVHHREARFGETLTARTWVSSFRRDTFSDRQIRVDIGGRTVISATQAWVHVATEPELRPARAAPELAAAFGVVQVEPDVTLPPFEERPCSASFGLSFDCWHTWMDPLAHVNHPAYVDWCDEALSRRLAEAGVDPSRLVPIAEEVRFRSGVVAPERVTVTSRVVGVDGSTVAIATEIAGGDGRTCATALTLRGLLDGDLAALLTA